MEYLNLYVRQVVKDIEKDIKSIDFTAPDCPIVEYDIIEKHIRRVIIDVERISRSQSEG